MIREMNGNNLEHLVFISWTCTISSADVSHSEEVSRGDGDGGIKLHIVFYKHMFTQCLTSVYLYSFIFHEFPKVLFSGDKLCACFYALGLVSSFVVRFPYESYFYIPMSIERQSIDSLSAYLGNPEASGIYSNNVVPHLPFQ